MSIKRVFLIVLDSVGIGEMPDADKFNDVGSNTFKSCFIQDSFSVPNLEKLGFYNIDGLDYGNKIDKPLASVARLSEKSNGKDTTVGHWEIAGIVSNEALPTYPNGFPKSILDEFSKQTGRNVLCNLPYSGTKVIEDFGKSHMQTGDLIVYTSADSVFQIAAHEDVVDIKTLYHYCEIARNILVGKHAVGRVIARPFVGDEKTGFTRTSNRHDFSLVPPKDTMLDVLSACEFDVIPIGKIYDIFAGKGLKSSMPTKSNADGMRKTEEVANSNFTGLCFTNLVDFDMKYGHRNDAQGYAKALMEFDLWLGDFVKTLKKDDVLMITADHGCDPITPSTDHSREYVPLIVYGENIKPINLVTRKSFADIGKTILDIFNLDAEISGESFKNDIVKGE